MSKTKHTLVVMMGIPGSGKSTLAKTIQDTHEDCVIVSRDCIRFSLLDDQEDYFAKEKEVTKQFYKQIALGIKNHTYTIADATHINTKSRAKLFSYLRNSGLIQDNIFIVGVWVDAPLSLALKQNKLREGRALVPEEAIVKIFRNRVSPLPIEPFDDIIFVDMVYDQAISEQSVKISDIKSKLAQI